MATEAKAKPRQAKRVRVVVEYEITARDQINEQAAMIHVASGCKEKTGQLIELRKPRVDITFKGMDFGALRKLEVDHTLMIEKLSSIVDHLAKIDPSGEESKRLIDDARGVLAIASHFKPF